MPLTRTCQEPGCGKALNRWRSCGDRNCKVEAAWCDDYLECLDAWLAEIEAP